MSNWSIYLYNCSVYLTLYAITGRIRHVLPKFQFQNKKGSSKKFPNERRDYESVDEKEPILGYVLKNDEKNNSGCKWLNN